MANLLDILKALSDGTRFEILGLLLSEDLCVRGLSRRTGISEAAVSQHLKVLRLAGIVSGEKRGYFVHYSVNRNVLYEASLELRKLSGIDCENEMSQSMKERTQT